MASTATLPTESAVGQAANRAHDAVERTVQKVAPAIDRASSAAHQTIDRAAVAASDAADWAQDTSRKLADRTHEAGEACATFVRAQPVMSVVGALAVGYLLGRVFR